MKKFMALFLAATMTLALLTACGGDNGGSQGGTSGGSDPLTKIDYSDDTEYTYLYSSEITSMNYLTTSVSQNQKSLANFIDTLVEYDCYGNVVPCLAESWEPSADGLTWTFHLRKGVKWFDCDGKEIAELTANDFVYALRKVCDVDFDSDMSDMVTSYIKNASELYNGQMDDYTQLGVEAKDDYTLVYTLKQPCPYFITLLTYGCYLPVYGEYYESLQDGETNTFGTDRNKILYCGAYICSSWLPQEEYVWDKSANYWDADNVFITKIFGKYNAQGDAIAPQMYLRGELDECKVTTAILNDWLNGDNAKYVHPSRAAGTMMYLLFDFNPTFDGYDTDSYKLAVNNKNFRMSIATGLDKKEAVSAYDPYNAEASVWNLMMPASFAMTDGKDYVTYGDLPKLSDGIFDTAKAVDYKNAAMTELKAAGAKFPIQIPFYYNPSTPNQGDSCQLIEQQLEKLLGSDYIDITVLAGPATNYISEVRRAGIWGLFEAGWSPDYADPATYFEPFSYGWTFGSQEYILGEEYNTGYVYTEEDYAKGVIDDEELIGTKQKVFNSLVEAARAETDMDARYEKFAKAEAYALNEALMIPLRQYTDGYVASNMSIFDGEYSMAGICGYRYKGRHMLSASYNIDQYNSAYEAWEKAAQAAK